MNSRLRNRFVLLGGLLLGAAYSHAQTNWVSITTDDTYRYINANGIPNHPIGAFPNASNPNSLREQRHEFRVPLTPALAAEPTPVFLGPVGVAVNGVPFDPGAAEFWNRDFDSGWQYAALTGFLDLGMDMNNGHVQPTGAYHYHGVPNGLANQRDTEEMVLVGYAADGFPMYAVYAYGDAEDLTSDVRAMRSSYRLKRGVRPEEPVGPGGTHDGSFLQDFEYVPRLGDLDESNGRSGVTPEYPEGTYYYVMTNEFPFMPRALKGTMDDSFRRGPGGPGGGRGPRGFGGPPPDGHRGPPPHGFGPPPDGHRGPPPEERDGRRGPPPRR